ncbi:MAG: aspartate aminotransferase family protein [Oscillospiraceae bacterium]|nr:aspartate aminotransferase family protein [Oscillospiraceae bacterium]
MSFESLQQADRQNVLQTYARFPVAIDHGAGATLYDVEGKKYIDFTSGIGVNSIGYGNAKWVDTVTQQAKKLAHISNLFYSEPYIKLAETLCRRSGMAGAFFANSGAESNEGIIKLARKYSFDKYGKGRGTVITLNQSFHGRTISTLAATGQEVFHNYFFPFTDGFRTTPTNDMEGISAVAGHDVCAVLLELVQGEGGVLPVDPAFVKDLAALCKERDWLLLVDEVQTGIGRTGTLFAFQQYDIQPDAVSFAKGIAGGLPFGGFLANARCKDVLGPGTHATTFGGNLICAAAACTVLDILNDDMLEQVKEKGAYLCTQIEAMNSPLLGTPRGLGMMIGIPVLEKSNKELAVQMVENGLLCLTAGKDALRLLPPLTITKEEMDEGLAIMKQVLSSVEGTAQ